MSGEKKEMLFSRDLASWRVGEVAPVLFAQGKKVDLFSVPLGNGWAVFQDGLFRGQEKELAGRIVSPRGTLFEGEEMFSFFDATILRAEAGREEVADFVRKAAAFSCINVCLYPFFLPLAKEFFPNPATVISFPHGGESKEMKSEEISMAEDLGAGEFDVVANLSLIEDRDWPELSREFTALRQATKKPIKIILETGMWDKEQIQRATETARDTGLDWAKTSTGKNGPGASLEAVACMSEVKGIEIKASGGIRTRSEARDYLHLGVTRIGASSLLPFLP